MTRSYTPALAYPVLTPLYDLTLELFGFGARFKNGIARLADVGAGEAVFDGRANLRANLAGALPTMLTRGGFSVAEVAPRHRGLSHLLCQPRPT